MPEPICTNIEFEKNILWALLVSELLCNPNLHGYTSMDFYV